MNKLKLFLCCITVFLIVSCSSQMFYEPEPVEDLKITKETNGLALTWKCNQKDQNMFNKGRITIEIIREWKEGKRYKKVYTEKSPLTFFFDGNIKEGRTYRYHIYSINNKSIGDKKSKPAISEYIKY